ncbi:hypothetical protein SBA1_980028 [Candidatus Sulfotelmatobacter kueseliae]|uniref:Uncharacterized protein n=1 Tax=Candidatus Sulfotelmatobacter kueseliae TaxID=2042962 RepID=A0A2U3LDM6_9BACT|nr:hypothetical protein SBA1_980028 [Candidatus Sulfotelmatobacter kueseliae]
MGSHLLRHLWPGAVRGSGLLFLGLHLPLVRACSDERARAPAEADDVYRLLLEIQNQSEPSEELAVNVLQ